MSTHPDPASTAVPAGLALLVALVLALSVPAAEWLRPTRRTSDIKGSIDLARQVPAAFADWREDPSVRPVLPDPALQATLDLSYSQVLARTYIDRDGRRVMLSIAYGNDQSSQATAAHAPEYCYRSQGFEVRDGGVHALAVGNRDLQVQRLIGRIGTRVEPIVYWVTLDEQATLPGWRRKVQQLRYGLRGLIADGMVVRISTLGPPDDANYALLARFAGQWFEAMSPASQPRYFGAAAPR